MCATLVLSNHHLSPVHCFMETDSVIVFEAGVCKLGSRMKEYMRYVTLPKILLTFLFSHFGQTNKVVLTAK